MPATFWRSAKSSCSFWVRLKLCMESREKIEEELPCFQHLVTDIWTRLLAAAIRSTNTSEAGRAYSHVIGLLPSLIKPRCKSLQRVYGIYVILLVSATLPLTIIEKSCFNSALCYTPRWH